VITLEFDSVRRDHYHLILIAFYGLGG
jgi:hypothetical protein